jgi:hypothetical protein
MFGERNAFTLSIKLAAEHRRWRDLQTTKTNQQYVIPSPLSRTPKSLTEATIRSDAASEMHL